MTLRLRSNATSMNRAAENSRRALRQSQSAGPRPEEYPNAGAFDPPNLIPPHTTEPEAELTSDGQDRVDWAVNMFQAAEQMAAELDSLPLAERRAAEIQVAALNATAHELIAKQSMPPPIPRQARMHPAPA